MADKNLAELMRSAQQMYDKDIAKAEKFFEEALATASKIYDAAVKTERRP